MLLELERSVLVVLDDQLHLRIGLVLVVINARAGVQLLTDPLDFFQESVPTKLYTVVVDDILHFHLLTDHVKDGHFPPV